MRSIAVVKNLYTINMKQSKPHAQNPFLEAQIILGFILTL